MPPAGFEPATPATERPQTHVFGRAGTGDRPKRRTKIINLLISNTIGNMPYFPSQKMHPPAANATQKTPCALTPDDARVHQQAIKRAVTRCELEGASGHECRLTSWELRQTAV